MSTEDNKALVRRGYEALNQRNLSGYYELFAPDFVFHDASRTVQGLQAYKHFFAQFITAFPDTQFTTEDLIAEGDTVAVRRTFRGTHTGSLMGMPPTGRQVTTPGISIFRIANGKVVEAWTNADDLGAMQQLGVIPAPGQDS